MPDRIHEFEVEIIHSDGTRYKVHAEGERQENGSWHGWLVFDPGEGRPVLRTERETTQPNHADLVYWAGGVEPVYLEGALSRARPV